MSLMCWLCKAVPRSWRENVTGRSTFGLTFRSNVMSGHWPNRWHRSRREIQLSTLRSKLMTEHQLKYVNCSDQIFQERNWTKLFPCFLGILSPLRNLLYFCCFTYAKQTGERNSKTIESCSSAWQPGWSSSEPAPSEDGVDPNIIWRCQKYTKRNARKKTQQRDKKRGKEPSKPEREGQSPQQQLKSYHFKGRHPESIGRSRRGICQEAQPKIASSNFLSLGTVFWVSGVFCLYSLFSSSYCRLFTVICNVTISFSWFGYEMSFCPEATMTRVKNKFTGIVI